MGLFSGDLGRAGLRLFLRWIVLFYRCYGWQAARPVVLTSGSNPEDLCAIFQEKPDWYEAARDMQKKWGTPVHVPLAADVSRSASEA